MNIVEIAGHLGADPEVRFAASGQKIISLRVATNVKRQGKEETIWWRVTIFGDRFDKMLAYMKKGSSIIVIGEMNPPQIWTDKEGKQHVQLEIVAEMIRFSPFGKSDRSQQEGGASYSQNQPSYGQAANSQQAPYGMSAPRPTPQAFEAPSSYAEPAYGTAANSGQYENQYQPFNSNHDDDQVPF